MRSTILIFTIFAIFARMNRTQTPDRSIIIGDSHALLLAQGNINAERPDSLSGEGWGIARLKRAIVRAPIDKRVKYVFVSIGTNDGFKSSPAQAIELRTALRARFPNATCFVIPGSYGWGGVKNVQERHVDEFYTQFLSCGFLGINTAIGKCATHPNATTPSLAKIAREINQIVVQ